MSSSSIGRRAGRSHGVLRRFAALMLATASLLGITVATGIGTGVASAGSHNINCRDMPGPQIPDPNNAAWGWGNYRWYYYEFSNVVATPTFNVSDTRIATNNLTTPASATFTAQQSRTFSLTVSATMSASLLKFLNASVSTSITQSRTTAIGVSMTATVQPGTTVKGEYGVHAYNVSYDVVTYMNTQAPAPGGGYFDYCFRYDPERQSSNAPTVNEGWRLTTA